MATKQILPLAERPAIAKLHGELARLRDDETRLQAEIARLDAARAGSAAEVDAVVGALRAGGDLGELARSRDVRGALEARRGELDLVRQAQRRVEGDLRDASAREAKVLADELTPEYRALAGDAAEVLVRLSDLQQRWNDFETRFRRLGLHAWPMDRGPAPLGLGIGAAEQSRVSMWFAAALSAEALDPGIVPAAWLRDNGLLRDAAAFAKAPAKAAATTFLRLRKVRSSLGSVARTRLGRRAAVL